MTDTCSQFIAELREIAAETQFEFAIRMGGSADRGFKHDWKLARVLVTAARIPKRKSLVAGRLVGAGAPVHARAES